MEASLGWERGAAARLLEPGGGRAHAAPWDPPSMLVSGFAYFILIIRVRVS